LFDFLVAQAASDGVDMTRLTDIGAMSVEQSSRYSNVMVQQGNPYGEIGLVTQKDRGFWQDQSGPPTDPQAGNIPGGRRDILRTADFNNRTLDVFAPDRGRWAATDGSLSISSETSNDTAAAVFYLDEYLPSYYEVEATFNLDKPTGGWKSNGYVIFDYYSDIDFKFAGINVSTNKIEMGYVDENGWHYVQQSNKPVQIKPGENYRVTVAVNGNNVTVAVAGVNWFTYDYTPRFDLNGDPIPMNQGMVGLGMDGSSGRVDNFTVQILPPTWTLDLTDEFTSPAEVIRETLSGDWDESNGTLTGTAAPAVQVVDLGGKLASNSILETEVNISTAGTAGFVFDRYGEDDYKFVALEVAANRIIIGHVAPNDDMVIDATFAVDLDASETYRLKAKMQGAGIEISLNGTPLGTYGFNAALVDGGFGLAVLEGTAIFDDLDVRTNDSQFEQPDAPTVSIGDVTVVEGDSGTTTALLTVSLSQVLETAVTVDFSTVDDAARADSDYTATAGSLTFAAGETTKTIEVAILGDTEEEADEIFAVVLSNANGLELGDAIGLVTIEDDDAPSAGNPTVSIGDASVLEGRNRTTSVTLTVALSAAATQDVSIAWNTVEGSATAGEDYISASGTLLIAAGQTAGTITVEVVGDRTMESDETFLVRLTSVSGADIGDGEATVTILDDDSNLTAAGRATGAGDMELTEAELAPVVEAAITRWKESGDLTAAQIVTLDSIELAIEGLDGKTLGEARDGLIVLDLDAAGFGWFVDATPYDDSEFGITVDADTLRATGNSEAFGAMDLLTVVSHEIGHLLGFDHTDGPSGDELMDETLRAGVRLLPEDSAAAPLGAAGLSPGAPDVPSPAPQAPASAEPYATRAALRLAPFGSEPLANTASLTAARLLQVKPELAITIIDRHDDDMRLVAAWQEARQRVFDALTGAFRELPEAQPPIPAAAERVGDWLLPAADTSAEHNMSRGRVMIDWDI
jgi:hypothetical protein